jgi:hypothetical protein
LFSQVLENPRYLLREIDAGNCGSVGYPVAEAPAGGGYFSVLFAGPAGVFEGFDEIGASTGRVSGVAFE